jgi:hypothetical protein
VSDNIDRRVVEMQFDNDQFEKGVRDSIKSVENLDKSLKLKDAGRGLLNVSRVLGGLGLAGVGAGVGALARRFSTLGIVGMTAIQRITNAVITMGRQIFNSLSGLQAMKAGLFEYETQVNAIQTIMANTKSKGTSMDEIKKSLGELNVYADKTIYNFSQMAKNVGTFTAAGVDLETSVGAIKGISNLAAVTGTNATQSYRVMYQLSQALSSGVVKLRDWMSVENAGGMGGELFREAIMETARVHDIAIDSMIKEEGSFRDTLQKGWLTNEILLESLQKFTGDLTDEQLRSIGYTEEQIEGIKELGTMSNDAAQKVKTLTQLKETLTEAAGTGWARSWELIVGDFYQARDFYTRISDTLGGMINDSAEARNAVLEKWQTRGGRSVMIESMAEAFRNVMSVMDEIKGAAKDIFGKITSQHLIDLTKRFKAFVEATKIGTPTLERIRRIFRGLFSVVDIFGQGMAAVGKVLGKTLVKLQPTADGLLESAAGAGDFLVNLSNSIRETDWFGKKLESLIETLKAVRDWFIMVGEKVKFFGGWVATMAGIVVAKFREISSIFDPLRGKMKLFSKEFITAFKEVFQQFKKIDPTGIFNLFESIKSYFKAFKRDSSSVGSAFKVLEKPMETMEIRLKKITARLEEFVDVVGDKVLDILKNLTFDNFLDAGKFGLMIPRIVRFQKLISTTSKVVGEGAAGILAPGVALAIKNFINQGTGTLKGVEGILKGVQDTLRTFQKNIKAKTLSQIAGAIGLLAVSLIALSFVNPTRLSGSLAVVTALFTDLLVAMTAFDKMNTGGGMKGASKLVVLMGGLSLSIMLLSFSLKKLSDIEWDALSRGIVGITAITAVIIATSKILAKNAGGLGKAAFGMVVFGLALRTMVGAVKRFGELDPKTIAIGLLGISGVLAQFLLFTRLITSGGSVNKAAFSLVILSGSLYLMGISLKKIGEIHPATLGQGLLVMAGGLALFVAALKLMPQDTLVNAIALTVLAGAMNLIALALVKMGMMSWAELGVGMTALAGSLTVLVVALHLMTSTIAGAAALMIAAGALLLLGSALSVLGSLSLEQIGMALLGIVAVLAVLGIAAAILTPVVPIMLAIAAAMFLFGAAALAVGLAVTLFGAGIAALAAIGMTGIGVIMALVVGLVSLIPLVVVGVLNGISLILSGVISLTPKIMEAIKGMLLGIVNVIGEVVPRFIEVVGEIIMAIVNTFVAHYPDFIAAAVGVIVAFLTGIRDNIAKITTLAFEIVEEFITALSIKIPELVDTAYEAIITFIDGMTAATEEHLPTLIASAQDLAMAIIDGVISGITGGMGRVGESIMELGQTAIGSLKSILGINSPSKEFQSLGEYSSQGFAQGLTSETGSIAKSMTAMAEMVLSELVARMPQFNAAGRDAATAVSTGMQLGLNDSFVYIQLSYDYLIQQLQMFNTKFREVGNKHILLYTEGMKERINDIVSSARAVAVSGLNTISEYHNRFVNSGKAMAQGFAYGIRLETWVAEQAAASMAQAAVNSANSVLAVSSPSKVTTQIGRYFVMGFALGIRQFSNQATKSVNDLGENTVNALSTVASKIRDSINEEIDMNPTIRPVVDLTDIEAKGAMLNGILQPASSIKLSRTSQKEIQKARDETIVNTGKNSDSKLGTINLTQNNYSPKALDRIEIYRQTKNLTRTMKGLVEDYD